MAHKTIDLILPRINASARDHNYNNPLQVRQNILQHWIKDIDKYKKEHDICIKYINANSSLWAKTKACFSRQTLNLLPYYEYVRAISQLINLFNERYKRLMDDNFINDLVSDCPICLESMLEHPMVLPDCLHPVCLDCFIKLCGTTNSYQCPMRCNIIKYIYPFIIKISPPKFHLQN